MLVGERFHASTRPVTTVRTSTVAGTPPARSARATSSRPSTRRRQPRDLGQGAGDVGLGVTPGRDLGLEVLEPEPQRRERRPQLVRRVGDELLLRADEPLEPARRCR